MKKLPLLSIIVLALCLLACKQKKSDHAAQRMQDFVINISSYAKELKPGFIIIPQNGPDLAFEKADMENGVKQNYLDMIDAFGIEELYYNGSYQPDQERIPMLTALKAYKPVLVSEYLTDNANTSDAILKNQQEGFIPFIRSSTDYNYTEIPAYITNENTNVISSMSQVQNYLYLISTDNYATKQDFINAVAATNYDLLIIDLFFQDEAWTSAELAQMQVKASGQRRLVISYINIGSAEKFRYYWKKGWGLHHPLWIKRRYEGYDDEFWVKFWKKEWQDIIYGNDDSYMHRILDAGFDGAYLDNVEAYYFLYYKD